jgi:hypothetical protein
VCPSCHRLGLHVEGCCFCDSEQGFTHDDGCDAEDAEGDTPEKEDSAPIELSEVAQMFLRCAQPAVIEALCADECLPGVCLNGQIITDVLCEMDDDQLAELLLRSCAPGIDKDLLLGEVDSSEQFDAMCKACDPKTKVEGVSKCVAGWLVWADLELGSVSNEDLQQCFLRWAPLGTEFPDALLES